MLVDLHLVERVLGDPVQLVSGSLPSQGAHIFVRPHGKASQALPTFLCFIVQVNVLAYLETLCIDTGAANQLVNSSLAILFVRMLRTSRAPALRVRLASVLGLLVRHATYIADELSQSGQPALQLSCNLQSHQASHYDNVVA